MSYVNSAVLMGNLTDAPELRHTAQGIPVAKFTIAINLRRPDGTSGPAQFFRCEVWRGWAENLCKTARKGSLVLAQGRLRQDTWLDKITGARRSEVKLEAFATFHLQRAYLDSHGAERPAADETEEAAPVMEFDDAPAEARVEADSLPF